MTEIHLPPENPRPVTPNTYNQAHRAYDQEQRAQLKAQRDAATDPVERETYALAARAGFDWYDTESAARSMARHAAEEILHHKGALADIIKGCDMMLQVEERLAVRGFILEVRRVAVRGARAMTRRKPEARTAAQMLADIKALVRRHHANWKYTCRQKILTIRFIRQRSHPHSRRARS